MNSANFQSFRQLFDEECRMILQNKGNDYSSGGDRLSNFKGLAKRYNCSPMLVWAIYMQKHLDAITTFVLKGQVNSEPIRQRFADVRNYIDLGLALADDLKNELKPEEKKKCDGVHHTWIDISTKNESKAMCRDCGKFGMFVDKNHDIIIEEEDQEDDE